MRLAFLILAAALLASSPVSGQTPAGQVAARPAAAATPVNPVPPLEPQGYDYHPAGRRDPFISLVRRTAAVLGTSANTKPSGPAGLTTDEIVLRGLVKGRNGWAAMVKGVDNRSYTLRAGDALFDGVVKSVTPDGLIVQQKVNDPLSSAKTRDVRKLLRPSLEAQ